MTIYKIRAWTNKRITRGKDKGNIHHTLEKEIIILDKLKVAKFKFKDLVNEIKCELLFADDGHVELFIPHVFEDGTLAYWPDDNKYIEQYHSTGEIR